MIGAGGLAGVFLATLWLRALSFAGIAFSIWSIALPILAATLALGLLGGETATAQLARRVPGGAGHGVGGAVRTLPRAHVPHSVAPAAGVARAALCAALRGGCNASPLSVGLVDAMGDQGARLVRAGPHRPLRAPRRVVRRRRYRVHRRRTALSRNRGLDPGSRLHVPGPLGRRADEPAVLDARRRVRSCRVWRVARDGV